MKRSTILTLLAIVAVAGLFFYMTTAHAANRCQVCVAYHGRTNCATAAAETEQDAREGAQTTACGPLATGMDESIACGRVQPVSVQCRTR